MSRPSPRDIWPLVHKRLRKSEGDFDFRLQKILDHIEAHGPHSGGASPFDAIVEEGVTTDVHQRLFAGVGEALSYLDGIGLDRALVLVRDGTYTETANWTAPDDVVLFSAAQGAGSSGHKTQWDHAGFTCTFGSLAMYGLHVTFGAKQTGFTLSATGYFEAFACVFVCLSLTGGTLAALVTANYCHYDSCAVDRMARLGNYVWVRDMEVLHRSSTSAGDAVMANNWLIGNFMLGGGTGDPQRTWTIPTRSILEFETDTNNRMVAGAGGVSAINLTVASPTQCHVKGLPALSMTVTGTPVEVVLTGSFNLITLPAPATVAGGGKAHLVACKAAGNVDITGPATLDLAMGAAATLTLRGAITGTVVNRGATHSSGAWLNGVAMGASSLLVLGGGSAASGTARPYILDASSTHNFIMWPNLVTWVNAGQDNGSNNRIETTPGPAGGPAPANADYLVGTAHAGLSAEIVVGTTPGGELGGTWGSPTVDTTHSGSSHAGVIATHEAAADPHTGYVRESVVDAKGDIYVGTANDTVVRKAVGADGTFLVADSTETDGLEWRGIADADVPATIARDTEVTTAVTNHEAAADPHTGYIKESDFDAKGDLLVGSASDAFDNLGVGTDGQVLTADTAQTLGVKWATPTTGVTDHDALTGVSADDHHAQAHALDSADHTAGSFTDGSVFYALGGVLAEDNANLFYDETNKRLIIGPPEATVGTTAVPGITAFGTNVSLLMRDTDNDVEAHYVVSGGVAVLGTYTNHSLYFRTNNVLRARFDATGKLYLATDAGAVQSDVGLWAGSAVPTDANGADGDYYFRSGTGDSIYRREGGVWVPFSFGGVTDHGGLSGLTDDDHTIYLKEKASGGTAAEVPEHTHADAANAGTVSHDVLTGVSIDDHHARDHAASHAENGADELDVASLGSGAASDGHVATADGVGGVAWEAVPAGHAEDHDHDGSPTQKLVQANTHESADTDSATTSLHHTIGTSATQAAAGNHTHAGGADSADVQVFTADGTWTKPAGAVMVFFDLIGPGAGGGGGSTGGGGNPRSAGTGGGAGARVQQWFRASELPASLTVKVRAGGTGGAGAGTGGGDGGLPNPVGATEILDGATLILKAYPGGRGAGGSSVAAAQFGGGGGGSGGSGDLGSSGGSGGAPGAASTQAIGGQGATSTNDDSGGTSPKCAEWGGGAGSGHTTGSGSAGGGGGSSIHGPGGGGSGGPGGNNQQAGGAGGDVGSYFSSGGGAGGAVRTNGTNGTTGPNGCGTGGGGGGGSNSNAASGGNGGNGGAPGGGGGGGGAAVSGGTAVGGNGGNGGRGECRVVTYF